MILCSWLLRQFLGLRRKLLKTNLGHVVLLHSILYQIVQLLYWWAPPHGYLLQPIASAEAGEVDLSDGLRPDVLMPHASCEQPMAWSEKILVVQQKNKFLPIDNITGLVTVIFNDSRDFGNSSSNSSVLHMALIKLSACSTSLAKYTWHRSKLNLLRRGNFVVIFFK